MKSIKIYITEEFLADYYEKNFYDDLANYYLIEKDDAGFDAIKTIVSGIPSHSAKAAPNDVEEKREKSFNNFIFGSKRKREEQILFIALNEFMLATECALYVESVSRTNLMDIQELASNLNSFGYPWAYDVSRYYGDFNDLSLVKELRSNICVKKDIDELHDVMSIVEPFMFSKLIPFLKNWKEGFFNESFINSIEASICENINEGQRLLHRKFYNYLGLANIDFSHRVYSDYFTERFYEQLKRYFKCAQSKGEYLKVLSVSNIDNRRWDDGGGGNNVTENLLFVSILLYMYITQQSILKYAKEVEIDFHKCSGWPMVYSGPGAGQYLQPMLLLEEAGLSPKKYESLLLLEMVNFAFPFLREELGAILNGKEKFLKNIPAGQKFLKEIQKNHKRSKIQKHLTTEEKRVEDLLYKWAISSDDNWSKMLEKENIPIMMEYE